jgi:hypothetical protein
MHHECMIPTHSDMMPARVATFAASCGVGPLLYSLVAACTISIQVRWQSAEQVLKKKSAKKKRSVKVAA